MDDFSKLTPQQRALLESVSIPDLALGVAAPIKLLQTNSPQLLDSPENSFYLPGSMAGGYSVPGREGPVFLPVPPGFHGGPFALARDYIELEARLNTTGEPDATIATTPAPNSFAVWFSRVARK
jgi:hypothetical protein